MKNTTMKTGLQAIASRYLFVVILSLSGYPACAQTVADSKTDSPGSPTEQITDGSGDIEQESSGGFSDAGISSALSNEEKGLAIAREGDRRDSGFRNTTADLLMILNNANGESITREMRQKVLEVEADGDKSIMVFDRPRDLKGTAILTHTHKVGVDDQWLYLPALKRVKRISAADKSGPFMGSEFAYEDLASQEIEKYSYEYLRDEPCEGDVCFVVKRIPIDENSGYTKQIAWIDQHEFRVRRIDYYDRKDDLLKTMVPDNYQKYLERYWRALQLSMTNHQTGKSTILKFENYKFDHGIGEADFTRSALSRVR